MDKQSAEGIIINKLRESLPCPFCGGIPEYTFGIGEKSSSGSIGHYSQRIGCCKPTSSGQNELFFTNNHKEANYELWCWMACGLVDDWNKRS